jgi:glycosyltransferase involved in cell wall biosynthesis
MKLSIIIPIFNEKTSIIEVLRRVEAAPSAGLEKELILIDDYSTDGTRDVLNSLETKYQVLYHEKNKGKGAALRTGFQAVTGDIVIVQDADLEYDPNDYEKLLQPIIKGNADVVYGSRFLRGDVREFFQTNSYYANKFLTWLSNLLSGLKVTDMETCYKVFRADIIKKIAPHLISDRFGFEPEVTARVAKLKPRFEEVPISYLGRSKAEGKKIGWKDGVKAIFAIIYFNLLCK